MSLATPNEIPVHTSLTTSAPSCFRNGYPPFTVTIRYECITKKSIWALVRLNSYCCYGLKIKDPKAKEHGVRPGRIGPEYRGFESDVEEGDNDNEIVRLEAGQVFGMMYTLSTEPRRSRLRTLRPDVWNLVAGRTYMLSLGRRRWQWMYEDDMPDGCNVEERRALLGRLEETWWDPECVETFTMVD